MSNRFGVFTNGYAATLKIASTIAPALFTAPASQTVGAGAALLLAAAWEYNPDGGAGGVEWYSNGVLAASQAGLGTSAGGLLLYSNTLQTALMAPGTVDFHVVVTNVFGRTTSALARVTAALLPGGLDPSFDSSGAALSGGSIAVVLPLPGGGALAGGGFTRVSNEPRAKIARYLPGGALDPGWIGASNLMSGAGEVRVLKRLENGKILVAGAMTAIQGALRYDNLLRLNPDGSLDTDFQSGWSNLASPAVNGEVFALSVQPDGKIVIAGAFSSVRGATVRGVARLLADGGLDPGFASPLATISASTPVRAVAVMPDGRIWIGGSFTGLGSPARNYLARLLDTGALDVSATNYLNAGRPVYTLQSQPDGKLVVGGSFTSIGGRPFRGVARLTAEGAVDTRADPVLGVVSALPAPNVTSSKYVQALGLRPGGGVVVGGGFDSGGDAGRAWLYAASSVGAVDNFPPAGAGPNLDVRSIATGPDGAVWIGGYFNALGAAPARGIAKLIADPAPAAPPVLGSVVFGGGGLAFVIPTAPGASYRIEQTTSLADPAWSLYSAFVATGAVQSVTIPAAAPQQYFRVRTP